LNLFDRKKNQPKKTIKYFEAHLNLEV